jgi:Protein of unknown function (DUF3853)
MSVDLNKPLWQLTVGEFLKLQEATQIVPIVENTSKYAYGINGLAELLNCSRSTAIRIKATGKLDKAIKQVGRKIIIDSELAIKLFKQ